MFTLAFRINFYCSRGGGDIDQDRGTVRNRQYRMRNNGAGGGKRVLFCEK